MIREPAVFAERAWFSANHLVGVTYAMNLARFGRGAPRPRTLFSIAPKEVTQRYHPAQNNNKRIGHWHTGRVLPGDWDICIREFGTSVKFDSCRKHFLKGVPWRKTRAIPYGLKRIARQGKYDECRTEADLMARYARLDDLWEKTKANGSLPHGTAKGTSPVTGILVHVDRNGTLLFGNQGFHRLAIAQLLDLPEVTVVLGAVHPGAVKSGAFSALMRRSRL